MFMLIYTLLKKQKVHFILFLATPKQLIQQKPAVDAVKVLKINDTFLRKKAKTRPHEKETRHCLFNVSSLIEHN
jgi:type I site-specific restriction endonuclease